MPMQAEGSVLSQQSYDRRLRRRPVLWDWEGGQNRGLLSDSKSVG